MLGPGNELDGFKRVYLQIKKDCDPVHERVWSGISRYVMKWFETDWRLKTTKKKWVDRQYVLNRVKTLTIGKTESDQEDWGHLDYRNYGWPGTGRTRETEPGRPEVVFHFSRTKGSLHRTLFAPPYNIHPQSPWLIYKDELYKERFTLIRENQFTKVPHKCFVTVFGVLW